MVGRRTGAAAWKDEGCKCARGWRLPARRATEARAADSAAVWKRAVRMDSRFSGATEARAEDRSRCMKRIWRAGRMESCFSGDGGYPETSAAGLSHGKRGRYFRGRAGCFPAGICFFAVGFIEVAGDGGPSRGCARDGRAQTVRTHRKTRGVSVPADGGFPQGGQRRCGRGQARTHRKGRRVGWRHAPRVCAGRSGADSADA